MALAACTLGLIAAHWITKPQNKRFRPTKSIAALAIALLFFSAFFALMTWTEGTSASGAIMLFYVLGVVGYVLQISAIVSPKQASRKLPSAGSLILCLLAVWSWTSALSMYAHRGAKTQADITCILAPNPSDYDKELTSLWEMRLPQVGSRRTSPGGSYIWEYHAILVVQTEGRTEHYNWSKKWMRFEPLDPTRNPYLPKTCI